MNWLDIVILVIIALSAGISVMRGFIREAMSLAIWILAFWIALTYAHKMDTLLIEYIQSPTARIGTAFGILFIGTLLVGIFVNYLVGQLVRKTGLTGTDRMLGIIFGIGRGIVVVSILVLLAGLTQQIPQEPWWKESMLMVYFQDIAVWMKGFLPANVADNIVFT
jgi:membrane protein required for colicin V production